jgi:serine/threonine protein kinase
METVGSGSFGTVFKAADRLLDRMVAVKKITVHTGSAVGIKRCLRELTILRLCR